MGSAFQTGIPHGDFIIKLLLNPKNAQEMGQSFFEFVKKNYQWEDIASKLEKLLKN